MISPFSEGTLKKAIQRGLSKGNLDEELRDLGELTIESRVDAEAVCWGLRQLDGDTVNLSDHAQALAHLFQHIEDGECEAVDYFREEGIPELLRLFEELQGSQEVDGHDAMFFILKMLAMYGTTNGALKVIEAARLPFHPEGYMWSVILRGFGAGHPQNDLLYSSLKDPLPDGFIGVCLLDAANAAILEGEEMIHPFDSEEGKARLEAYLASRDPEEYSYAHSATAALPFISEPGRDQLLAAASQHPADDVRIEAAWAAAKLGRPEGLQRLCVLCRDFKTAEAAKRFLVELGREDVIPPEANEPSFVALAEFAQWCAHPNELGRVPDELEIVDHRELLWPPEREAKPFWLIRYKLSDASGVEEGEEDCGLVGSVTFCFFSYRLAQRPPEDGYAVHCYWEMEQRGLIEEADVADNEEYAELLQEWSGPALSRVRLLRVSELSPELKYPQRLLGLASAELDGEPGWVVLDGPRTRWYPGAEQPPEADESAVLMIHVGRRLLGL
jgi:hypothetical protein